MRLRTVPKVSPTMNPIALGRSILGNLTGRETSATLDNSIYLRVRNTSGAPRDYMSNARKSAHLAIEKVNQLIAIKDCEVHLDLLAPRINANDPDPYIDGGSRSDNMIIS